MRKTRKLIIVFVLLFNFSAAVGVPKSLQMRLKVHSNRMQTFWSPTAMPG